MKILLLLLFTSLYLFSAGFHGKELKSCDQMYYTYTTEVHKIEFYKKMIKKTPSMWTDPCSNIGTITYDYLIDEEQDKIDFLEIQAKTLGVACEQSKRNEQKLYKSDYCNQYLTQKNTTASKQSNATLLIDSSSNSPKMDPEIQYKKAPILKTSKASFYAVKKISNFRDREDICMIEADSGNFAVPKVDIIRAERINFTPQLNKLFDAFLGISQ